MLPEEDALGQLPKKIIELPKTAAYEKAIEEAKTEPSSIISYIQASVASIFESTEDKIIRYLTNIIVRNLPESQKEKVEPVLLTIKEKLKGKKLSSLGKIEITAIALDVIDDLQTRSDRKLQART